MTSLEHVSQQQHITDLAARIKRAARLQATTSAFAQDWKVWSEYCGTVEIPNDTVDADLLTTFTTWLATDTPERDASAPATIERRLTGVLSTWKWNGLEVPRGITSDARSVLKSYRRWLDENEIERGRGEAPAVTVRQLREISEQLPDTLAGLRDRALLLIGFAIASRRSELARLSVQDISGHENGLLVKVRAGKTGSREPAVLYGSNPLTCPIRSWNAYRAALVHHIGQEAQQGQAFRSIDRHGNVGPKMSKQAVGDRINKLGRLIGVDNLTGHSLRAGFITTGFQAGHDAALIAAQSGHQPHSRILFRYRRVAQKWQDNAMIGLGL